MKLPCLVAICLLAYLLQGCLTIVQDDARPLNVLNDSVFADVLVDYALAESAAAINIREATYANTDSIYAFNPLKDRGIRPGQYDSTLLYFSQHIEDYKAVYNEVLDRLSALQAEGGAR